MEMLVFEKEDMTTTLTKIGLQAMRTPPSMAWVKRARICFWGMGGTTTTTKKTVYGKGDNKVGVGPLGATLPRYNGKERFVK